MDPVSLIIAAIAAGITAGAQDTAAAVVKDAYAHLKGLLHRRLGGDRDAEAELERAEHQPQADLAPLEQHLRASGAGRDEELLAAARALLEKADPEGSRTGKYNVRITGGKGIVVGDNATTTMNFGDGD